MIRLGTIFCFAVLFGAQAVAGQDDIAIYEEEVRFQSAPVQPTPFQIKRAKAKGIELKPKEGLTYTAYLAAPKDRQNLPAVIVMPSGDGIQESHFTWIRQLARAGYTGLLLDPFGSRGFKTYQEGYIEIFGDALAAYRYLEERPEVDPTRIGIMGFSLGGTSVFKAVANQTLNRPKDVSFKAGISVYPQCELHDSYGSPLLIMAGDRDKLINVKACENLKLQNKENVSVVMYPGGTHFFDNPAYAKQAESTP